MKHLIPLRRAVVELSGEAESEDEEGIKRAVKSWYNRLHNGSVPRSLVRKFGRGLFVDVDAWDQMFSEPSEEHHAVRRGRPRTKDQGHC